MIFLSVGKADATLPSLRKGEAHIVVHNGLSITVMMSGASHQCAYIHKISLPCVVLALEY